ncbi:MAG: hypothetical protein ACE5FU_04915 [Nitrospinota bacterium]
MSRTKREIQEELDLAKSALEKQKAELDECRKEREKAEVEIETLKDEQARKRLKVENTKPSEAKDEIKRLQTTIIDLKNKLAKPELIDVSPESGSEGALPFPKANFHVEIWKPNGHYRAVIEHRQSKKKERWGKVDQGALMSRISGFIDDHLPTSNEEENLLRVEKPTPGMQEDGPGKQEDPANQKPVVQAPKHEGTVRLDVQIPTRIMIHDQPFLVKVQLDSSEFMAPTKQLRYRVFIYAKRLGYEPSAFVGEFDGTFLSKTPLMSVNLEPKIQQAGTYRVDAFLTSIHTGKQSTSFLTHTKSDLFQVC